MNLKQEKRYLKKRIEGIEGAISVHQDAIDFHNPCDVEIKCRQECIEELMVDLEAYRSYLNFLTKSMDREAVPIIKTCKVNEDGVMVEYDYEVCSRCEQIVGGDLCLWELCNYCPNCGAKMKGE